MSPEHVLFNCGLAILLRTILTEICSQHVWACKPEVCKFKMLVAHEPCFGLGLCTSWRRFVCARVYVIFLASFQRDGMSKPVFGAPIFARIFEHAARFCVDFLRADFPQIFH